MSLAALLSIEGLPFSEAEISEYALTGSILLTLSTGLFLLGVHLLKGQKMDKNTYFYISLGIIFLYALAIFLFAARSARHLKDTQNIDL